MLLSGGFLLYFGYTEFAPTVAAMFLGVLSGDLLIFSIGRKWGKRGDPAQERCSPHDAQAAGAGSAVFRAVRTMTILLARFLAGLRSADLSVGGYLRDAVSAVFLVGLPSHPRERAAGHLSGLYLCASIGTSAETASAGRGNRAARRGPAGYRDYLVSSVRKRQEA